MVGLYIEQEPNPCGNVKSLSLFLQALDSLNSGDKPENLKDNTIMVQDNTGNKIS